MSDLASYEELSESLRQRATQRNDKEREAQLALLFNALERHMVPFVPDVGDLAPDFTLPEAGTDQVVRLQDRLASGPVVLSFYRGQWCPYCNIEARALESIHERVAAAGGSIFLIGPETEENALQLRAKSEATIPLLFDADAGVCRLYHLGFELPPYFRDSYLASGRDLASLNPQAGWILPIPATFVVDRSGLIVARHLDPDYTKRMEPAAILAAVEGAAAATR